MWAKTLVNDIGGLVLDGANALIGLFTLAIIFWSAIKWVKRAKISIDDVGGLALDGGKILIGLSGLTAGLWFSLGISRSNLVTWFFLMGPVTAILVAMGTKFPPRRVKCRSPWVVESVYRYRHRPVADACCYPGGRGNAPSAMERVHCRFGRLLHRRRASVKSVLHPSTERNRSFGFLSSTARGVLGSSRGPLYYGALQGIQPHASKTHLV
jgi:hypothetical protein